MSVANWETFQGALQEFYDIVNNDKMVDSRRKYGTSPLISSLTRNGNLVTKNFQTGLFDSYQNINEEAVRNLYVKNQGCFSCIHLCTHMSKVETGPFAGLITKKPEFETLSMLGSNIGVGRLDALMRFSYLID